MYLVLVGNNKSKLAAFTPDLSGIKSVILTNTDDLGDVGNLIEKGRKGLVMVDLDSLKTSPGQVMTSILDNLPAWEVWAYYDSDSSSNTSHLEKLGYSKVIGFKDHPVVEIEHYLSQVKQG